MAKHYRLLKGLASGGMADVWIGLQISDTGFSKVCAIKTIKSMSSTDSEFITMFRDEAKICQSLQHANIVQVLDFTELSEGYALVMEFVQGVNLYHLMRSLRDQERVFPLAATLFIGQEIAKALNYVHSRKDPLDEANLNIVHRDISPSNILLSSEGEVKVTDFGIAKANVNSHSTQVGVVKGKYQYMSPEQFRGEKIDSRTDIYSLGCVLWECLAGRKMYEANSDAHLIQMIVESAPRPPLQEFNPFIDKRLSEIIEKAMHRDPGKRYQTAGELSTDIYHYMGEHSLHFGTLELSQFLHIEMDDDLKKARALVKFVMEQAKKGWSDEPPSIKKVKEEDHDPLAFGSDPQAKNKTTSYKPQSKSEPSGPVELPLEENATLELKLGSQRISSKIPNSAPPPPVPMPVSLRSNHPRSTAPVSQGPQSLGWNNSKRESTKTNMNHRRLGQQSSQVIFGLAVALCFAVAAGLVAIAVAQYGYGIDVIGEIGKFSAKIKMR